MYNVVHNNLIQNVIHSNMQPDCGRRVLSVRRILAAAERRIRSVKVGQAMQKLDYAKMGTRIRQIRKAKGWSQDKLAKKCGISLNFMGHIERGTRKMSMDTFANLCRELETDADALLWGVMMPSETAMQGIWGKIDDKDDESYSMYIRIMKSVADIMNSRDGCP